MQFIILISYQFWIINKNMNYLIDCKICNLTLPTNGRNSLKSHLQNKHKINYIDYYDKFYKKANEGICFLCNKKTRFRSFFDGYAKFCSAKCNTKNNLSNFLKINNVQNTSQLNYIKKLKKEVCIEKYGVVAPILIKGNHVSNYQRKNKFESLFTDDYEPLIEFEDYKGTAAKIPIKFRCKHCDNIWEEILYATHRKLIPLCRICNPANTKSSKFEFELVDLIQEVYNGQIVQHYKKIFPKCNSEIDIYLPELNLAIEFDGLYWHTEYKGKHKNYHLYKTEICEKNDIQLLHIFQNEWLQKKEIVKSILLSKIGVSKNRFYARHGSIAVIDAKTSNLFLENNHLQGKDSSSIRLALYYKGEIVNILTLGKSRFNKNYDYEIFRFCNKLNYNVVGGFSKLLSYFFKNYSCKSLITYADRRYSNGDLYFKNGFKLLDYSKPNYFYTKDHINLESRQKYQKHKLKAKLQIFDDSLSEYQNMKNNGFNRIWDCGNMVFHYIMNNRNP